MTRKNTLYVGAWLTFLVSCSLLALPVAIKSTSVQKSKGKKGKSKKHKKGKSKKHKKTGKGYKDYYTDDALTISADDDLDSFSGDDDFNTASIDDFSTASIGCPINHASLNKLNQAETDMYEGAVKFVSDQVGNAVRSAKDDYVTGLLLDIVFSLGETVGAGQSSAEWAEDPNEDRFSAIENFQNCANKQFEKLWKAINKIEGDLEDSIKESYTVLLDGITNHMKHEVQENLIKIDIYQANECLRSSNGDWIRYDTTCGPFNIKSSAAEVLRSANILSKNVADYKTLHRRLLQNDVVQKEDQPYPVLGRTKIIDKTRPINTMQNDGFDTPDYSYDYTEMRTILLDFVYTGNLILLAAGKVRDWAMQRGLYRMPDVLEDVWYYLDETTKSIEESFIELEEALMHGKSSNLRIVTTDSLQPKIFCFQWVRLKKNGIHPGCRNRNPEGWIPNGGRGFESVDYDTYCPASQYRMGEFESKGSWWDPVIGTGDIENFCSSCVDPVSFVNAPEFYDTCATSCYFNEVPTANYGNQWYTDTGPSSQLFQIMEGYGNVIQQGAPVDPILYELREIRRTAAIAMSLHSYWRKEKSSLGKFINRDCELKEIIRLGHIDYQVCAKSTKCFSCPKQCTVLHFESRLVSEVPTNDPCGTAIVYTKNPCMCGEKFETYKVTERNSSCGKESYKCGTKNCWFSWCDDKFCIRNRRCEVKKTRKVGRDCVLTKSCSKISTDEECKCVLQECIEDGKQPYIPLQ